MYSLQLVHLLTKKNIKNGCLRFVRRILKPDGKEFSEKSRQSGLSLSALK